MSSDVGDDSFYQFFDHLKPANASNLNAMPEISCGDRLSVSSREASGQSEKRDQGNSSIMLRESKLRKPTARENDECAASSGDEMAHNIWQKYRPRTAINFSDLVEERTIDACISSPSFSSPNLAKHLFEPTEFSGRSTGRLKDNSNRDTGDGVSEMSVDVILGESFVHEIRNIRNPKNKLDGTDDKSTRTSLPVNYKTADSIPMYSTNEMVWNRSCYEPVKMSGISVASEDFAPFDQMQEKLSQDEKEWQNEFGILPAESDRPGIPITSIAKTSKSDPKVGGKLVNLTEFSGYLADNNLPDNNLSNFSTLSLGQYFGKRCEDVREMFPNRSPTKHNPIALLDSYASGTDYSTSGDSKKYSQASSSFYTDDELQIRSLPRLTNATYEKKSIMSVSSIAAKLGDDSKESPASFVSKYTSALRSMSSKIASASTASSTLAVGKSLDTQSSATAFTTANTSIGMLAQMNSTRIEDDKENQEGHRKNASAETELASEFSHFMGDLSSDASSYDSSFKAISPPREPPAPTNHKRGGLEEPRSTTNMKRMRSPQSTTSGTIAQLLVPDAFVKGTDAASPNKGSPMKSNEEFHLRAESHAEIENEGGRQFMAMPHRSPMNGSKFSLPNYGLRNNARALSQSPSAHPVRSSSQLSTNSEFSQNDGKFPLKANRNQLTWECVKLQKSITKSFVVKNTAHKRLTVKMHVTGPGFQIATGLQEQGPLVLQGNECRTISVIFCPTVIGKAIGKVTFKPSKGWPDETERSIQLYAYGGHTTLQLQGIERGPVGVSFLKMGETCSIRSTTLQRVFFIYNKGPLNGMATISVKPKTNQYIHETHIQIEPSKCIIKPDSSVKVTVAYKLRRKDLERLSQKSCEVLTVATLEVIIGADPNRQRISTILMRSPSIPSPYRSLDFLVKDFPHESAEDFGDFCENLDNIADLFNCFKTSDVALTINRTMLDETRDTCTDLSGIEESFFFRTLVDESVSAESSAPQLHHNMGSGRMGAIDETWSVYPQRLNMDQMDNNRKQLTIRNDFNKPQTFQVESNFRHLFTFSPESGLVNAGNECKIDVQLKTNIYVPSDVKITILIESDSIEIPVTVRPAPPPYSTNYK